MVAILHAQARHEASPQDRWKGVRAAERVWVFLSNRADQKIYLAEAAGLLVAMAKAFTGSRNCALQAEPRLRR